MGDAHLKTHRGCGGGLVQSKAEGDGRPLFSCARCGYSFTNGKSGGPWAAVVPSKDKS